jgi:hypothetical protein
MARHDSQLARGEASDNVDLHDSQRVNAVNGSYREMAGRIALHPSDPGPIPDCLAMWKTVPAELPDRN